MRKYDELLLKCRICESENIHKYHQDLNGNSIYICEDCKVQCMNPQYSDEYLDDFYSKYTKDEPEWDEPLTYGHKFYLSLIEKYTHSKGTFLDIGCGKGHLLKEAKKSGWEVFGYDVDCKSTEYFSKKHDIKMYCGDFERIKWESNSYNLVSMHQVFEHLKNPISQLQTINSILIEGGILFIVLPNIKSLSSIIKFRLEILGFRQKDIGKYYDTSHHLFYYEPKTLKKF